MISLSARVIMKWSHRTDSNIKLKFHQNQTEYWLNYKFWGKSLSFKVNRKVGRRFGRVSFRTRWTRRQNRAFKQIHQLVIGHGKHSKGFFASQNIRKWHSWHDHSGWRIDRQTGSYPLISVKIPLPNVHSRNHDWMCRLQCPQNTHISMRFLAKRLNTWITFEMIVCWLTFHNSQSIHDTMNARLSRLHCPIDLWEW